MAEIPAGPWRAAFDEAWASWCAGNFGIGAVLHDPATDAIVTRGRNRVEEEPTELRQLAGNFMAHAEMNAFAALERRNAKGLHLYTTLEPCPMCDGTALMLRPDEVHFAAVDALIENAHQVWQHSSYAVDRIPGRRGPLDGVIADFAELLPATYIVTRWADDPFLEQFRRRNPRIAPLAHQAAAEGTLRSVATAGGDVNDALAVVAEMLGT